MTDDDFVKSTLPAVIDRRYSYGMAEIAYVSHVHIERRKGPLRIARLPAEPNPVKFSTHGAVAKHYGVDASKLDESHATTLDYIVAAAGG